MGPAVELDISGGGRAPRVVREPEPSQLATHVEDVVFGGLARVLAGLHGVLLGRQAERVIPQRVQHIAPTHPLEAAVDVGRDVAQRVPDVQARTARVREHVEDVELLSARHALGVGPGAGRVGRLEGALALPHVLPVLLDPAGKGSGIAVQRLVVRGRCRRSQRLVAHRA